MDTYFAAVSYTFVSSNQSADRGTYIFAFVSAYMDTDISANDSSIENPFVYAHVDSNIATIGYSI